MITNVLQAAQEIPSIVMTPATGTSNAARIILRGAGQEQSGIQFDSAVGVYIDNVYQPRITGQFFDFFDVDQLEVLRGPQGTLYGRNTSGGAIKLTTRTPDLEKFTAAGDLAYGSYQMLDGRLYMSTPIVAGKVSASISAVSRKRDGWTSDPNNTEKLNDKNQQAFRGKLYLAPSDALTVAIAYDLAKDRSDPGIGTLIQSLGGLGVVNPNAVPGRDLFTTELSGPAYNKNDTNGLSVNASYVVSPELTINSITGTRNQRATIAVPFVQTAAGLNIGSSYQYKDKFWSQELNGTFQVDRLKGVAGFYYFWEHGLQRDDAPYTAVATRDTRDRLTKTWAGFGQATYEIFENLGLTAGIRYTHEEANFTQFYFNQLTFPQSASTTFTAWTPKFGIDYQALPNLLLYASFTKGFKSGGWNNVSPSTNIGGPPGTIAGPAVYGPENVKSYEAGAKFMTDDNRLRLNVAVFQADYDGMQLPVFFPGTTNTYTSNAAGARVRGIELEPTWQITDVFQIYGNASFDTSKYTSAFNCALYNSTIVNCGAGGRDNRIKGVVPAKSLLGLVITPQLNIPGSVRLATSWAHNGAYYNNVSNTLPLVQTPRADLFDASISWQSEDARWRVTLEGKNIFDHRYALESLQISSPVQASITTYPNDPRMVDVRVRFSY